MLSPDLIGDRSAALSLLGWWQDAGLDMLVDERPRDWLAPPAARPAEAERPGKPAMAPMAPALPMPELPDTLAAFTAWLARSDAAPEAGWGATRLLPGGDPAAGLMILVDMPEPGDAEAGQLLAGSIGRLFDAMLRAIGRDRASIWLAPLTTIRPPGGRLAGPAAERAAALIRHQIGLVGPRRLLTMGDAASRATIGADAAGARSRLHPLNLSGRTIEAVATYHPRLLLDRPAAKAQAWRDLQLLMKGL